MCIGRNSNLTNNFTLDGDTYLTFPILQLGTYALIFNPRAPVFGASLQEQKLQQRQGWFEFMVWNNLVVFITINVVAIFLIFVLIIIGCCTCKEKTRQSNIIKKTIKSKKSVIPDHILDPDVDKEEFIARLLKQLTVLEDKKGSLINEKKTVLKRLIKQQDRNDQLV